MTLDFKQIILGDHSDPFAVLGMHEVEVGGKKAIVVRAFTPGAEQLWAVDASTNEQYALNKIHDEGFFELVFSDRDSRFPYRLKATNRFGDSWEFHDAYSFSALLSDYDLHLMAEGTHYRNYE